MTVRERALKMILEYELEGKFVNLSLSSRSLATLTESERSFLVYLLYRTVENKLRYDYCISALTKRQTADIDLNTLCILRLGIAQLEMDSLPAYASVNETVKLARHKGERAFVNGVLRSALKLIEGEGLPLPPREKNVARYLSVKYSFPLSLTKKFISILGEEETEKLYIKFSSPTPTDITVNTAKISRTGLLKRIKDEGYCAEFTEYSSLGIRITGKCNPTKLPGFNEGYFFVQDEASMLSAEALGTEKGDTVVDVCACPGGKSFAAAILAGEEGKVLSFDISDSKLSLITSSAARLGLNNVTVCSGDASVFNPDLCEIADRVICDCPCSGLGVLWKKPDMRYSVSDRFDTLPPLQSAIIDNASRYVKRGGVMVYSTCTINPDENERVVEKFLSSHPEFEAVDFTVGALSSKSGTLTLLPHKHGTDGFFITKLRKKYD